MLPKGLILVSRTTFVVGDMRSPTICTFWISFSLFGQFLCERASPHTTHFGFLVQFGALCPKPWHLKHCQIECVVLNSSALKFMPIFWHTNPCEMSASACFVWSHLILMKSRSLPDLTAAPYGCNDQIKGVGTLSSP